MSGVINPGFGEVALSWQLLGDPEPMVTTFGIFNDDDTTDAAAYATQIRAALVGTGKLVDAATMFNQFTFINVKVSLVLGVHLYVGEDATQTVGTVATSPTAGPPPNNTSLLVQKRGAIAGRRNRGRFYWPIYSLDRSKINSLGFIDATFQSSMQTKFTTFLGALNTTTGTPMRILHSVSEVAPTEVSTLVVQAKAATQRRRMRP